jgi:hypothetical protein
LNNGQSATLTIRGTLTQPGSITNTAELTAVNEPDPDSSPGNGVGTEDDQRSIVIQVTQPADIAEQYRLLMQQITTLVNKGALTAREGRILTGFVALSLRWETNGQIQPAIATLRAFILVVRYATQRTHLTNADRNALILAAQNIINKLRALPNARPGAENGVAHAELAYMENDAIMKLVGLNFKGNYPNPFNSFTNITFELAYSSKVQLTVFDVHGKVTARLLDKTMQPGTHTVNWQAPDLPGGVYILQMKVDDFVKTVKMVHTK